MPEILGHTRTAAASASEGLPTLTVSADGAGDYPTIATALAAAPDEAVVLLMAGRYVENVVLARPVTLTASEQHGAATIHAPSGNALTMMTTAATVRGVQISG